MTINNWIRIGWKSDPCDQNQTDDACKDRGRSGENLEKVKRIDGMRRL